MNRRRDHVEFRSSHRSGAAELFCLLLIIFLIAFPKGGFRFAGVPITHGYVLICVASGFAFFGLLGRGSTPRSAMSAWFLTLPFQTVVLLTTLTNGVVGDVGDVLACLVSFLVFPNVTHLLFANQFVRIRPEKIAGWVCHALRFVFIFGITLFVYQTIRGSAVEIPLLTTNIDDVDVLISRNNIRGDLFKLTSTYNNGNIFAVCTSMLLPMYYFLEKRRLFFIMGCTSLFLSLSRTAWLALIIILVWVTIQERWKIRRTGWLVLFGGATVGALPSLLVAMREDLRFLLDTNLGGRANQFQAFSRFELFPDAPVGYLPEVVYAGIYGTYGLLGLLTFILFLVAPILVAVSHWRSKTPVARGAVVGLSIYCLIAWSDAAILYIPTMAIYCFVALVALTNLPIHSPTQSARHSGFRQSQRAARIELCTD